MKGVSRMNRQHLLLPFPSVSTDQRNLNMFWRWRNIVWTWVTCLYVTTSAAHPPFKSSSSYTNTWDTFFLLWDVIEPDLAFYFAGYNTVIHNSRCSIRRHVLCELCTADRNRWARYILGCCHSDAAYTSFRFIHLMTITGLESQTELVQFGYWTKLTFVLRHG